MRGARMGVLAGLVTALQVLAVAVLASPAGAATFAHAASQRVALVPQAGPVPAQGPNGIMPTSSVVSGRPTESFSRFRFTDVPLNEVTPAGLAPYDTVALIQVSAGSLTAGARSALAAFVARGGKLIIHDSDQTHGNDYSWLLPANGSSTRVGAGCNNCGSTSGSSVVTTNSGIVSASPSAPSYVNLGDLYRFTDQGDANLLVSTDPRWFAFVQGTNGRGESGAQVAFAKNNNGVIIYNGFDTDFIKANAADPFRCNDSLRAFRCAPPPAAQPTVDWLAHMWYDELAQAWGQSDTAGGGAGLPTTKPVIGIGRRLSARAAGLPSSRHCVANRKLRLRLTRLAHVPNATVVRVDVYVNGRHVLREGRPFAKRTLRVRGRRGHLTGLRVIPRRGRFTVTVIATTDRGFHLIAKRCYRVC